MKRKRMLLVLTCATVIAVGGLVASCKEKPSTEYAAAGVYYAEDGYTLTLNADYTYTLEINGETFDGTFTVQDGTLTMGDVVATVEDNVYTIVYKDNTYTYSSQVREKKYTVEYETNGAPSIAPGKVELGGKVSEPSVPQKAGYVFAGWYQDADFKTPYNFHKEVSASMKLYARFVEEVEGREEFTVSLVDDGKVIESKQTVGGKVYALPQLADKEGREFLGWWTSDFESEDKLTGEYREEELYADSTFYAVWEQDAPVISVTESSVYWTSVGKNASYALSIVSPEGEKFSYNSGFTSFENYNFATRPAGEYEITVTANGKAAKAYYLNKALDRVSHFRVEDGYVLSFNDIQRGEQDVNYYITVACANEEHEHVETLLGKETEFDFSACEMREEGISFVVTAKADGFVDSVSAAFNFEQHLDPIGEIKLDEEFSRVTWTAVDNATEYVVVVNDEEHVVSQNYYSVENLSGELRVSVYPVAKMYNSSAPVKTTLQKDSLPVPTGLRISGYTVSWEPCEGATSYKIKVNDTEYDVQGTSYTLDSTALSEPVEVSVMAVGKKNSPYSAPLRVTLATELIYRDGKVFWAPVLGVSEYTVSVDGTEQYRGGEAEAEIEFLSAGEHTIALTYGECKVEIKVNTYTVSFNTNGGGATFVRYIGAGDTVPMAEASRLGYDLVDWYDTQDDAGGNSVTKEYALAGDITVYAHWTPKAFSIRLDTDGHGSVEDSEFTVYYDQPFELPVPVTDEEGKTFTGWYTEVNGGGQRFGDASGRGVWKGLENGTVVYACWSSSVLKFTLINDPLTGQKAYAVSKGDGIHAVSALTIPYSYKGIPVTSILSGAFQGCASIEVVNIPDTVTDIEAETAFGGCSKLSAVYLYKPEGEDVEALFGHYDPVYVSLDGMLVYINPYRQNAYELRYVPYTVFHSDYVEIPYGVNIIALNALRGVRCIEAHIPASVYQIDQGAFRNATLMQRLVFDTAPAGETGATSLLIDKSAFEWCSALTEVVFPGRLSSVASDAFKDCGKLESFGLDGECKNFTIRNNFLCNGDGTQIVLCPMGYAGAVRIPSLVTSIAERAFYQSAVTELIIPGYLREIGAYAFYGCASLKTITYDYAAGGEQPLSIGVYAFYGCKSLQFVLIPANVTSVGTHAFGDTPALGNVKLDTNADVTLANGAFLSDSNVSYVVNLELGASVPEIAIAQVVGMGALQEVKVDPANQSFKNIDGVLFNGDSSVILHYPSEKKGAFTIPDTVTSLPDRTFQGNTGLTKIEIPASVTNIGEGAFEGCKNLSEIVFGAGPFNHLTIQKQAFKGTAIKSITLPEGTEYCANGAFEECTKLREVNLPASLSRIDPDDEHCFALFDTLKNGATTYVKVTVATGNPYYKVENGILYALKDGTPVELLYAERYRVGDGLNITVPSTVVRVWSRAFANIKGKLVTTAVTVSFENTADGKELTLCPYAFADSYVSQVALPEGLKIIGAYAFFNCPRLTTVSVSSTVERIDEWAFGFNSSDLNIFSRLASVTFAENAALTTIQNNAFYNTSKLTSIALPAKVDSIAEWAFGRSGLTAIEIPSSVMEIGKAAFAYSANLSEVKISTDKSFLQKIGGSAFVGTALASIELPSALRQIDPHAFFELSTLTSVTFGDSLESIGAGAFANCTGLTSVTLPRTLSVIDFCAFQGCSSLASATFDDAGNSRLMSVGTSAFGGTSLESFAFPTNPEGEIKVSPRVFLSADYDEGWYEDRNAVNTNLKEVSVSSSILSLAGVFDRCYGITTITIADDNPNYKASEEYGMITNRNGTAIRMLYGHPSGTAFELTIPDGITEIGDNVFAYYDDITKVTIPASVTRIGDNAFYACKNLGEVVFAADSRLNYLGVGAFAYNAALPSVVIPDGITVLPESVFEGCGMLSSVTLPAGLLTIGNSVFNGCTSLIGLEIPDRVREIGDSAFRSAGLQSLSLPESVKTLGHYAFEGCKALSALEVPGVETFGDNLFSHCEKLTAIEMPSAKTLGRTFYMTYFKELYIPGTVKEIYENTFSSIGTGKTLTKVEFGEGLTRIYPGAFGANNNSVFMDELILPKTYVELFDNVFKGAHFEKITLKGEVVKIPNGAFSGNYSLREITLPSTVIEIGENAFYNCRGLNAIVLPENLLSIGAQAFMGCDGLRAITLPKNVTVIGDRTFSGCKTLASAELCGAVTGIGAGAFEECEKLERISLGDRLIAIGENAFNGSGLTEIYVPGTVQTIGKDAFANCANLTDSSITIGDGCPYYVIDGVWYDLNNKE